MLTLHIVSSISDAYNDVYSVHLIAVCRPAGVCLINGLLRNDLSLE